MLYDTLKDWGYLDRQFGTVSNNPYTGGGYNCDNPSLFTAEALMLSPELTSWPMYSLFISHCEIVPGLYRRYPGNPGDTSQEEIMGAATLNQTIAALIFYYGDENFWIFRPQGGRFVWSDFRKSVKDLWASFKGRFVWLRPYVKHCMNNMGMNPIDQVLWSVPLLLSHRSEKGDTESKIYFALMISRVKGHYPLCDWAIKRWNVAMTKKYPGGLRQLMMIYFGSTHPFIEYAPPFFK